MREARRPGAPAACAGERPDRVKPQTASVCSAPAAGRGAAGLGTRQARAQPLSSFPSSAKLRRTVLSQYLVSAAATMYRSLELPVLRLEKVKLLQIQKKTMTKTFSLVRALVIRTNVLFDEHDREKLLVSTTVSFFPMCLFVINPHFKTRLCPESIPNCDN